MTKHEELLAWVEETAKLTQPERIHWCDGSKQEYDALVETMVAGGDLIRLNPETHPGCTLHRSNPTDVARTEHLTFVCTVNKENAGPNNNWMEPREAHEKVDALFAGSMKGRTMYVVPYVMGPITSPYARAGVEITDSAYVAASMRIMTRMGKAALQKIESDRAHSFVRGLHSVGDLDPERRFIMHFPEELTIKSVGSGYGGNALLGKKCHALRIASWEAREHEGWLAEHMLIVGVETPAGETHYIAAPSRKRATRSGRLGRTSPGCTWGMTGGSGRSIPRRAFSAWRPARVPAQTPTPWQPSIATPSSPTSP
jgi:phosphoenolpyruvate carboxykinase (GTP)